ncbi:unnamed protein product [Owenia fusiformis]|uniref:Cationic amino acid transporter C-terminal domain-containing protein n=1 Tax=Owenia fusiformis TaxID=6347 RepID=A0A8S4MUD4_OWEFU|nr:unnamed protein product [Owenia fusiformis]
MAAIVSEHAAKLAAKLIRTKKLDDDRMETPLKRCLGTVDLTLLGIGSMVGAGLYVLTGTVVKDLAGPGAILSYLIAGLAAMLSSLCYAEFGARVPKAGSAYTYTYVTMGEFWAFIIGWNVVLEYMLGLSSVARAFSGTFDSFFNGAIRNGTINAVGEMHGDWLSPYPDFIAAISIIIALVCVAAGAKISVNFNSIFTVINVVAILTILGVGFSFADIKNWQNEDTGGFLPFGFQGVFAGAATLFYSYVGFDAIAVAGEEAKDPARSIPIATVIAMLVVTVLYFLGTSALTLMVPYYAVTPSAAFPEAFASKGVMWFKYFIAAGSLFGITTSLLTTAFAMPRIVYAMASDGLLFRSLAKIHPKTQTPIIAIFVFGFLAAILAFLFEIDTLVEFLSIGTLLAFTIVAISIIILRYQPITKCQFDLKPEEEKAEQQGEDGAASDGKTPTDEKPIVHSKSHDDFGRLKQRLKTFPVLKDINPGNAVAYSCVVMLVGMMGFNGLVLHGTEYLQSAQWWAIILLLILTTLIIACYLVIIAHEQNTSFLTFQIPGIPLIPACSMFINTAMMLKLSYLTWIRLAVWLAIGLVIYFAYGIHHSSENKALSEYSQIISYAGPSMDSVYKMEEDAKKQQPDAKAPPPKAAPVELPQSSSSDEE